MSDIMKDAMKKAGINMSADTTDKKHSKKKQVPRRSVAPTNVSKPLRGKVKWFDFRKGYGFIIADDGTEHFVYHTNIALGRNYLGFEAGDEVEFRVAFDPNSKNTKAVNVSLTMEDSDDAEPAESKPDLVTDDQGDQAE